MGRNSGDISACYSHGGVNGYHYVGGFTGIGAGSIANCYSTGVVYGWFSVGGFMGVGDGRAASFPVSMCYSVCRVHAHGEHVGGFSGRRQNSEIIACFWDMEAGRITDSDGAVGLTTGQMQEIDTYLDAGWDFTGETANGQKDVWVMTSDTMGYPRLAWEVICQGKTDVRE